MPVVKPHVEHNLATPYLDSSQPSDIVLDSIDQRGHRLRQLLGENIAKVRQQRAHAHDRLLFHFLQMCSIVQEENIRELFNQSFREVS